MGEISGRFDSGQAHSRKKTMCVDCVKAVNTVFPEVPEEEIMDFLMNCTAFPFGDDSLVKSQLEELRTKTSSYKECYRIEEEMESNA